jgi:hypothetical protein
LGWNALPTSRNAKGVDIMICDQQAKRTGTIQAKSLTKLNAVPMSSPRNLIAKYLVIVRNVDKPNPELLVTEINDELKEKQTN